jgi:hypothetical protein
MFSAASQPLFLSVVFVPSAGTRAAKVIGRTAAIADLQKFNCLAR